MSRRRDTKAVTTNGRTLVELRRLGYVAQIVEKRVPRRRITVDFHGFADVHAMKFGEPFLLVQATDLSVSNYRHHIKSIFGLRWNTKTNRFVEDFTPLGGGDIINPVELWLQCGGRLEVWAWPELILGQPRGKDRPERTEIRLDAFDDKGMIVLKLNVEDRIKTAKQTVTA